MQANDNNRSGMMALPGASGALAPMSPYQPTGLSIPQIVAIGRARWRQGAWIAAAIVVATALVSLVIPKTYTATATVMVSYDVNDPLGGREFPAGLLSSYMSTQVELLGSPATLLEVVDRLKLTQNKDYIKGFDGDPRALREWVARRIAKDLEVKQGNYGSQLLNVTFSANDAQLSASVANAVVEAYSDQAHQRLTTPAADTAHRYTKETEDLKAKVGIAQQRLDEFRQQNNMVDIQAKADIDIAVLNELEHRLLDAKNARRAAEGKASADPSVSASVLGSTTVQTLKAQLSTEQAKMAELRATLGARHPDIVQLQQQIDSTRHSLQQEIGQYASGNSSDLAQARQLEDKLAAALDEQRAKVLQVRRMQDEGSRFQIEFDTAQAAYKNALEGYEKVMIASTGQYTNVNITSRATPPLRAAKPKFLINLLMGIVFGGALGIAIPFARELAGRRVRCRDDLERDHGVPVLVEFDSMPAIRNAS
jgi:uncharacterized protein involved in exopolysaccharide biosynthesis